jgi:hypothetical protein
MAKSRYSKGSKKCEKALKSMKKKVKESEEKLKKCLKSKVRIVLRKSPVKKSKRASPKKTPAKKRVYKKKSVTKPRHAAHSYYATVYPEKAKRENRRYKAHKSAKKSPAKKRKYKKSSSVKKAKPGSSQDVKMQMRKEMNKRAAISSVRAINKYGSGGGKTGE